MEDLQNLQSFSFEEFLYTTPPLTATSGLSSPHSTSPTTVAGFVCTENACGCGQHFRRRSELKKHVDQHTRPYACAVAGCAVRSFSTKHDLQRHHREVHRAGGALLVCPMLGCKRHMRGFARKENLALHVRNMHPNSVAPTAASHSATPAPMDTAPLVASPAQSPAETSSSLSSTEALLRIGLQDRLTVLRTRQTNLMEQLQAVDEEMAAVQRTLQGLGPEESDGADIDFMVSLGLQESEAWNWEQDWDFGLKGTSY